jgi:Protein of unknown function (DUF6044)
MDLTVEQVGKRAKWAAILILLLQFVPYLILMGNSYVRVHDTLEGEWVWYHLLVKNEIALNFDPDYRLQEVMNGLQRYAFHSGISLNVLWIWLFGTLGGYICAYILIHLIAFWGMYRLLRRHFLKDPEFKYIIIGVATMFAWVPCFIPFGLSVAGQPLIFSALLAILLSQQKWYDWVIVIVFPFWTSIVWAAPAVMGLSAVIGFFHFLDFRKVRWPFWGALSTLGAVYIGVNFNLFAVNYLTDNFISHRTEYNYFYDQTLSLGSSFGESFVLFLFSHYHVGTFVSLPVIVSMIAAFYGGVKREKMLPKVFYIIVSVCLFFGFYGFIVYFLGKYIPILAEFKFNRISILLPFLWLLLFALALARLNQKRAFSYTVFAFLMTQLILGIASNDEFMHNIKQFLKVDTKPNYREYFAEEMFKEISDTIGLEKSTYRVISLGMSPTIALYNGFYTLDGLQPLYDLRYKHKFREIMSKELEKNMKLKNYFDEWGNRCYLFSSELGNEDKSFLISRKDQPKAIKNLAFNIEAFRELGGKFIFSTVKIENAKEIGITFVREFSHPQSWWTIYLYKA